jgi:hypothetical protein
MIEQRLAGLALDEQRLLEAASVAGSAFPAASLAAGLEAEVEAVEDRCEVLCRREQFVGPDGVEEWPDGTAAARYRFLHALYQQVLYERLPPARRASVPARPVPVRSRPPLRSSATDPPHVIELAHGPCRRGQARKVGLSPRAETESLRLDPRRELPYRDAHVTPPDWWLCSWQPSRPGRIASP